MMNRKQGFTLVELLVVMAIIAILAAIAIPNVQRWIQKSRAVQAVSEIQNIELAITKVLSDAGRNSLNDLFDPVQVEGAIGGNITTWDAQQFEDAIRLYTNATYALLRRGREAPLAGDGSGNLLRRQAVRVLGLDYMPDLGTDPWGQLYNIFPGPWNRRDGVIPFRTYLPRPGGRLPGDDSAVASDELTLIHGLNGVDFVEDDLVNLAPEDGIGYPAGRRKVLYIWSKGANTISGQALFTPGNYTNSLTDYVQGQEPELMGGGDDINNWDNDQTFMRFYN